MKPVILFRPDLYTEEEMVIAKKYFDVYTNRASIPEGSIVNDNEELEDEDLEICDQCEENGWDGYICHYCGAKNI